MTGEEAIKAKEPVNDCVHLDDIFRLIAGHSDYHGDDILSAFTCLTEGKKVNPITPIVVAVKAVTQKAVIGTVRTEKNAIPELITANLQKNCKNGNNSSENRK